MTGAAVARPRRAGLVVALWLAALLLAAWQITRTPFTADLSAFLPASPDASQRLLIDQLKSGLPARTLMLGIDGGTVDERAAASRALGERLRASGRFEQVQNGDQSAWQDIGTWVFERRYVLSPAVEPGRFTPAGLQDAFAETLSLLGTPAGNALKPLLERDPTGETQRIAETMIPTGAPRTEGGVWSSRAGGRAVLLAVVQAEGADLDAQMAAIATVRETFAAVATPGLTLKMSGTPVFSVDSRARIEAEVEWLAIAGTVLMCTLLLVAFGSPLALLVAALPVATGVVVGIAAVGLGFGGVHGITLGFGATLIGEAVDYGIYYLVQAHGSGRADDRGWRHWLATGWPTIRLGLLTSVCGFAALVFSGFPGLAQLGVFSVAGLLAAALTTRWLLPVLMPAGSPGQGLRRQLGRAGNALIRTLPRTRTLWLVLGAAAVVVLLVRGDLWRADLAALSPVPREAIALDESLRADLGSGDGGAIVLVTGDTGEQTLQRAEAAGVVLESLIEQGRIAGFESVARLVPSLKTQQARLAALPDADTLRAALAEATKTGPLKAERLAPFVDEVQRARTLAPHTLESARGGPAGPLLSALVIRRSDGGWAALLPVTPLPGPGGAPGSVDAAAIGQALAGVPGAQILEIKPELDRLYDRYLREAQAQALLGSLGVVLLVALVLRSPRRVLAVCQPLVLAVLLTIGALAALGLSLGILHLVALLLVVAVGSNYALFFDLLRGQAQPDDDTVASLMLANLTTVSSFALIAFSSMPALSAIGIVVAPGSLLALVLAAAFAPRRPAPL